MLLFSSIFYVQNVRLKHIYSKNDYSEELQKKGKQIKVYKLKSFTNDMLTSPYNHCSRCKTLKEKI